MAPGAWRLAPRLLLSVHVSCCVCLLTSLYSAMCGRARAEYERLDSNGDLVDALMHIIESMQQCTHCGLHVDPSLHGGSCPCCNKSMTGRVLRDTTVDSSRIDYSGLDGDDCVNSKESIYEPALTSRPTYRSCTSHGPAVGQLPP